MESNLDIKTSNIPKFNVKTVSSAVFGKEEGGSNIKGSFGESIRNIHKTLSKLSGHVRKSLVRIKALEGIEKITEKKKDNIGDNQDNLSKSLIETNKILVGIQQQLALQSSNEQKEQKAEIQQEKREKSKKRLKAEESALEKTAKGIGKAVAKTAKKIISPIGNIFDKILDFVTLLGAGIAVNAAFDWFKDPKNRKKITKFFNILKQNWKLLRNILLTVVGAGIIIKVVSALTALGGVLAFLASPIVLKVLAAIAAGVVAYKAGKFLVDGIRNLADGGENFTKAYDQLNQQLEDAGMTSAGVSKNRGRQRNRRSSRDGGRTEEQEKIFKEVSGKRDKLDELRKTMDAEVKTKQGEIDYTKLGDKPGTVGAMGSGTGANKSAAQAKVKAEVEESYIPKIQSIISPGEIEGRAMGGPVTAKTPYLVGESGPEIFTPNVDGSVINNMKTEKIYQMISSRRKSRGGINMINLPPITNQMPPPEIPVPQGPATEVPDISSVNMADPYRQITPMLYGITV